MGQRETLFELSAHSYHIVIIFIIFDLSTDISLDDCNACHRPIRPSDSASVQLVFASLAFSPLQLETSFQTLTVVMVRFCSVARPLLVMCRDDVVRDLLFTACGHCHVEIIIASNLCTVMLIVRYLLIEHILYKYIYIYISHTRV